MNAYREFSVKQQIVFYAVTLLIASFCIYLDLNHDLLVSSKEAPSEAVKIDSTKKFLSGNEVAHSTLASVEFK